MCSTVFPSCIQSKYEPHKSEMLRLVDGNKTNQLAKVLSRKVLSGWKRTLLSRGGQLSLIKSMLSNLPVYYISLITMLASIANKVEVIQYQFLWGDSEEKR